MARGRPALTVVIPALNEAAALPRTLAALAPLRARGCEVIVVDGGSRDATVALASRGADRVLAASRGRGAQLAAGVAAARGPVVWMLHADTLPPPHADRLILAALADGRRVWGRFDVRLEGAHPLLRVVERLMNLRSRLTGIATGDQGIFARAEALAHIGGVPAQPLMEDVELSRRLKRLSRPACLRACVRTSARRWLERGVLRTILLMWRLRLAYFLGASPEALARRYG